MTTVSAAALMLAAGMGQATAQQQQQPPAQQEQQRTQQQGQQQQGQQRQARQQQECTVGQQADMEIMRQVQSSQVRRDLRTLRDAALLLKEYDKQGACQQVVTAIQDVARERGRQAMAQQQQRGQEGQQQQAQQGQQQQRDQQAQRRQQAEPATQAAQNLGVDQMLESDVIGSDGDVVGEVTDIVLSKEGQPQYVVVAFGGFLGLGEDRVAIPFDMLRMRRPQEEGEAVTFYVPMTEQKLTDAPRIRPGQNWQQNEQWQSQNRQYFEQNRQRT
jgi:sporulation protein YlmC with PRC-barrel domain